MALVALGWWLLSEDVSVLSMVQSPALGWAAAVLQMQVTGTCAVSFLLL